MRFFLTCILATGLLRPAGMAFLWPGKMVPSPRAPLEPFRASGGCGQGSQSQLSSGCQEPGVQDSREKLQGSGPRGSVGSMCGQCGREPRPGSVVPLHIPVFHPEGQGCRWPPVLPQLPQPHAHTRKPAPLCGSQWALQRVYTAADSVSGLAAACAGPAQHTLGSCRQTGRHRALGESGLCPRKCLQFYICLAEIGNLCSALLRPREGDWWPMFRDHLGL